MARVQVPSLTASYLHGGGGNGILMVALVGETDISPTPPPESTDHRYHCRPPALLGPAGDGIFRRCCSLPPPRALPQFGGRQYD